MAALSLADLLPDFASRPPASGHETLADQAFETVEAAHPSSADDHSGPVGTSSIDQRIAEAEAALRERLSAEHEAALESERARHAEEVQALEARLGGEAGAAIESRLAELESRVTDLATSITGRILGVTLTEDLQKRAVAELARTLHDALADREAVRVTVSGPPQLFEALQTAMGDKSGCLTFCENGGFDLTVSVDETLFETRLSEWSDSLAAVLS